MTSELCKIAAKFNTTLNLKTAIGATSATLDSATDDSGVALPTGRYGLTIDGGTASEEFITCTLTGTALTSIKTVTMQGTETSGMTKTHRKGATVKITDFVVIKKMLDVLDGTTSSELMTFADLSFTGTTTSGLKVKSLTTTQRDAVSNAANGDIVYNSTTGELNQYIGGAWSAVAAGSTQANSSTTVAGKVETATSGESIAGTDVGGTGANLMVLPSDIKTNLFTATQGQASVYGLDAGGDDTYLVALVPVLAAYTTGQKLSFKSSTANTGACTVNFGPSVLNIKTKDGNDPQTGVIRANVEVTGAYDGTNFVLDDEDFATTSNKGIVEMATDAEVVTGTDQTRYINPYQLLFSTSVPEQLIPVKVSANTGYATNLQMGGATDGSVIFAVTYHSTTTLEIFRLVKETTGQYIISHTTTLAGTSFGDRPSCSVAGDYVYVTVNDNGTGILRRYAKADLSGVTSMTISGTAIGTAPKASFSDGTNLYIYSGTVDIFRKYTISGTTATYDSNFTYTSAGSVTGACCDGTSVWTMVSNNGTNTIYKYALAGGASTANSVRFFYTSAYNNAGLLGLTMNTTGKINVHLGNTMESNTAIVASAIKLNAITAP